MRNQFSAVIFCSLTLLGTQAAQAQSSGVAAANPGGSPPPISVPTPAPVADGPNPYKLVYVAEYKGNTIGAPVYQQADGTSAVFTHDLRAGYGITPNLVLGVREKLTENVNNAPAGTFVWSDIRVFFGWAKTMETTYVDMDTTFEVFFPTSNASQAAGQVLSMNLKNMWTFKTSLRNWSFQFLTIISPSFYNNPESNNDYGLSFIPLITVDIFPSVHIYFELDTDVNHAYANSFFNYNSADPGSFTIGPLFDINSHITFYPSLRFYTANLAPSNATLYFNLTAAL